MDKFKIVYNIEFTCLSYFSTFETLSNFFSHVLTTKTQPFLSPNLLLYCTFHFLFSLFENSSQNSIPQINPPNLIFHTSTHHLYQILKTNFDHCPDKWTFNVRASDQYLLSVMSLPMVVGPDWVVRLNCLGVIASLRWFQPPVSFELAPNNGKPFV